MQIEVLPDKYTRTSESLVGLGAVVISLIADGPKSLDNILEELKETELVNDRYHGSISMDTVVLALDFLYIIDAVKLNSTGLVEYASR